MNRVILTRLFMALTAATPSAFAGAETPPYELFRALRGACAALLGKPVMATADVPPVSVEPILATPAAPTEPSEKPNEKLVWPVEVTIKYEKAYPGTSEFKLSLNRESDHSLHLGVQKISGAYAGGFRGYEVTWLDDLVIEQIIKVVAFETGIHASSYKIEKQPFDAKDKAEIKDYGITFGPDLASEIRQNFNEELGHRVLAMRSLNRAIYDSVRRGVNRAVARRAEDSGWNTLAEFTQAADARYGDYLGPDGLNHARHPSFRFDSATGAVSVNIDTEWYYEHSRWPAIVSGIPVDENARMTPVRSRTGVWMVYAGFQPEHTYGHAQQIYFFFTSRILAERFIETHRFVFIPQG